VSISFPAGITLGCTSIPARAAMSQVWVSSDNGPFSRPEVKDRGSEECGVKHGGQVDVRCSSGVRRVEDPRHCGFHAQQWVGPE
jgi:hypothetical protein